MGKVIAFPGNTKKKDEDGFKQAMMFMAETSLIHAFLALTTHEQVGAFLYNHPEMLTESVQKSLLQYSQMAFGEEARYMKRRLRFLQKCQKQGLEKVFPNPEKLPIKVQPVPDEVDQILEKLDKPSHIQALDETERRLSECRRGLNMFKQFHHPLYWARLKLHEADALVHRKGSRTKNAAEALTIYDQLAKVLKRDAQPFRWTQLMEGRAVALSNLKSGDRNQHLQEAADCLSKAVTVVRDLGNAGLTGRYQYKLAHVYRKLKDQDGKPRLAEAAVSMKEAVVILGFDKKDDPYPFAFAQVELADILLAQTGPMRMDNAAKALGILRETTTMTELKRIPMNWVFMNRLLGDAAMRLAGPGGAQGQAADYLEEAVKAFGTALELAIREKDQGEIAKLEKRLAKAVEKRRKYTPGAKV